MKKQAITPTSVKKTLLILVLYYLFMSITRVIIVTLGLHPSLASLTLWPTLLAAFFYSRKVSYSLLIMTEAVMIGSIIHFNPTDNTVAIQQTLFSAIMIAIISEVTFKTRIHQFTLNQELREAKEAADKAGQAKGIFLANMSHEIRTPISGIIGITQMFKSEKLSQEQNEMLSMIQDSSDVLLNLVNNILDYSKIEAGKLKLHEEAFSPYHFFEKVGKNCTILAESKGLSAVISVPDNLPNQVLGDRYRFRQILTNLISNATKFTEKGSVSLKVTSETIDNRLNLDIVVADTGCGIPEETQERLFQPFEQGDSSYQKSAEGTGLGLSIVKLLTTEMGGEISVFSRVGFGSEFRVLLSFPILPSTSEPIHVDTSLVTLNPDDHVYCAEPMNILLAEDNRVNQLYLTRFLEKAGFTITLVENGLDALNKAKAERFHAILMDI